MAPPTWPIPLPLGKAVHPRDIEIIISDDASTDDSVTIAQRIAAADPRVRLITSTRNSGPGAARNRAIAAAMGEWLAVLDSDDFAHPDRLDTLLRAASQDGADVVADDLLIFVFRRTQATSPMPSERRFPPPWTVEDFLPVQAADWRIFERLWF